MATAQRIEKSLSLGAQHSLYYKSGTWYHKLERFPGILFDSEGYIRFNTANEYLSDPNLIISATHNQVHTPKGGICTMPGYQFYNYAQYQIVKSIIGESTQARTDEKSLRRKREIDLLLRNQSLVAKIKKLYSNTCQICCVQLEMQPNSFYSEVHHIKPLGKPYNGPDRLDNMLCVCPNHHAQLDFFAIKLDVGGLKMHKHMLSHESVTYHNEQVEKL